MKIGFIDYYLDEWHANSYPEMIRNATGGKIEAVYAYGQIANPVTGMDSKAWCEKYGLTLCDTIEEVIEKSDALIVLSPDNVEKKEELSRLALMSGKRTYIDKTFAPDKQAAERMFALADAYNTPCYSTSALRFAPEYAPFKEMQVKTMCTMASGKLDIYIIHQLEPLIMLMQGCAKRVMAVNQEACELITLEWEDGRSASVLSNHTGPTPYAANIITEEGGEAVLVKSKFFQYFIANMLNFFETGVVPVPHEETVAIIATREAILKAVENPGCWIDVE